MLSSGDLGELPVPVSSLENRSVWKNIGFETSKSVERGV